MKFHKSRGSALLITLIVMGIASVLIFSISKVSMFQQLAHGSYEASFGAYYGAEAGINIGMKHQSTGYHEEFDLPNGSKYIVDVADIGGGNYKITSVGMFGKVKHQIIYEVNGTTINNRNFK